MCWIYSTTARAKDWHENGGMFSWGFYRLCLLPATCFGGSNIIPKYPFVFAATDNEWALYCRYCMCTQLAELMKHHTHIKRRFTRPVYIKQAICISRSCAGNDSTLLTRLIAIIRRLCVPILPNWLSFCFKVSRADDSLDTCHYLGELRPDKSSPFCRILSCGQIHAKKFKFLWYSKLIIR